FALIDEAALVAMKKFDGVFDGDEVIGAIGVDAVDHRSERGGLARTGGSGDEHETALLFANLVNDVRKIEFLDGADFGRNDAEDLVSTARRRRSSMLMAIFSSQFSVVSCQ